MFGSTIDQPVPKNAMHSHKNAEKEKRTMLLDHAACLQTVAREICPLERQQVTIDKSLSRVATVDLRSMLPQPGFRQSLRDGYVLAPVTGPHEMGICLPIAGTIGAGDTEEVTLEPETTLRIMTGAPVPTQGERVIPLEQCSEENGRVHIPAGALSGARTYVQETGSELATGAKVVAAGTILQPEHIGILATTGTYQLEVFRRPRVAFFCTGSELVNSGTQPLPGQKISSNQHLLDGLIRRYGADPRNLGTVADSHAALAETFANLTTANHHLVISTGGMGPGKFDLIEQTFLEAGGRVIYNRLDLTPGKNSLFGRINGMLFFGLPGPPTAVHALMTAIVGPSLLRMQGVSAPYPKTIKAHLGHALSIRKPGIMQLRSGILLQRDGFCQVRPAKKWEVPSCYIVVPGNRSSYDQDELIDVQLTATPFGGTAC